MGLLLLGAAALVRVLESDREADARRWWLAAALLALAVCLKLTPLAPVLLLCAVAAAAGVAPGCGEAVLFLLPFLSRPPVIVLGHYREWIDHLLETGNDRWVGFRDGWTIWVVLRHLVGSESGSVTLRGTMDSTGYRLVQLATAALR